MFAEGLWATLKHPLMIRLRPERKMVEFAARFAEAAAAVALEALAVAEVDAAEALEDAEDADPDAAVAWVVAVPA